MSKKLSLWVVMTLLTVFGFAHNTMAQNHKSPSDANVFGHVVDARTGEHIPGVTIQIKGTLIGSITDNGGHYLLSHLTPGKYTLVMRGVGYESQERDVTVEMNKVLEVNFEANEDVVNMDEVVVTANRSETLRRLAPTVVGVIDNKIFNLTNSQNLLQGLSFQPGLRVENNCQNCNFNQVRINGLDGKYSQILIDSRPIFSALAGVYGLEQIPTSMVERIEVVRGGGSALYGSSAIGGVINIITKEPKGNSAEIHESLALTGLKSIDNNLDFNASVLSSDTRAGAIFFGQARNRKPWDANGDRFSELGKLDSRSFGTRAFFKTSDRSRLAGEIHTIHEYRRGGDHLNYPDHVAQVSERVDHAIYSGNLKFDAFTANQKHHFSAYVSAQNVKRDSYYGGIGSWKEKGVNGSKPVGIGNPVDKQNYGENFGVTRGLTVNSGAQYTYDMDHFLFMPAQVLAGVEYTYDHLNDVTPIRQWTAAKDSEGKNVKDAKGNIKSAYPPTNQKINNFSQFAQIEWKNEMFSLLLGGRFDEHSLVKRPIISPRATFRYNPTHDVNLRLSYAKGFRAPQIFDEDLHVGIVNGEQQKIINVVDLKPETSHSVTVSADMFGYFGGVKTNLLIEGFYNRILDVFTQKEIASQDDGFRRYERVNGKGARVFGANIEGRLYWQMIQFNAGMSISSSKYDNPEEWGEYAKFDAKGMPVVSVNDDDEKVVENESQESVRIMRTPNAYGYFTLDVEPVEDFHIALNGNIYGSMLAPHAIVYGAGAAVSDRKAGNDASKFEKYFEKEKVDEKNRDVRIDELKKTPLFFDMGIRFSYTVPVKVSKMELYLGMSNLLDSRQKDYDLGPDRDSAYMYGPLAPRTLFCGIKFSF